MAWAIDARYPAARLPATVDRLTPSPRARFRTDPVDRVDEGLPVAYQVLEEKVPVFASGGEQIGTVGHVVSAPAEDIFHGIVIRVAGGQRFVPADQVASLHEHGVDLRIDVAAAADLPRTARLGTGLADARARTATEPLDASDRSHQAGASAFAGLDPGGLSPRLSSSPWALGVPAVFRMTPRETGSPRSRRRWSRGR